ncbi:MAG: ATP-binding protein [Methylobacterium sp.]|nr:ATP-binding protein [Methylobacterium sp.]
MLGFVSLFQKAEEDENPFSTRRLTRTRAVALARQQRDSDMVKRSQWTEADVLALGPYEHDSFERKGGRILDKSDDFENTLAKALSAFANSGGGSIVLGMKDDGTFDGLPLAKEGRASTRDWLETKIPHLLDYPLSDFRVHIVVPSTPSLIPAEKIVIVVDVGDSAAAPHQSKRDKIYYRREGGRSVPAPHFYIELLRQRLTSPNLVAESITWEVDGAYETAEESTLRVALKLKYRIRNVGRVAATHWAINARHFSWPDGVDIRASDVQPRLGDNIRVGSRAILPDCTYIEELKFALQLRPIDRSTRSVADSLDLFISNLTLKYQIATESSPGEPVDLTLASICDRDHMLAAIRAKTSDFFMD